MNARAIALMAPTALGLLGVSSHEPFHADDKGTPIAVTERSDLNRPQWRRAWRGLAPQDGRTTSMSSPA